MAAERLFNPYPSVMVSLDSLAERLRLGPA